MKRINIILEAVTEDLTKMIPAWMDELNRYGRNVWLNYNHGGYARRQFKTLAGLKLSITCHAKQGGIPSGKLTVKYNRLPNGYFEAWVNYN
ncbi:hypothetical protein KAR91_17420 [Candidatus Pacearchaeota archaeon]|nr:hypothetical protein [Candidatus Pacearchaeota archaeon]